MNRAGETRSFPAGDKLPEYTRDKLPTGGVDSTFLGRLFETVLGNDSTGVSGIPSGNNLRSRLPRMLVRNACVLRWGMLRSSGDNPTSLRLTAANSAWGERVADSLEIRCLVQG